MDVWKWCKDGGVLECEAGEWKCHHWLLVALFKMTDWPSLWKAKPLLHPACPRLPLSSAAPLCIRCCFCLYVFKQIWPWSQFC